MADKLSKKEIEQPDWFHAEFARIIDIVSRYRTQVAWIAGVVVSLIIVGLGWYLYRIDYEKKAERLYAETRNAANPAAVPAEREKNAVKVYESVIATYPGSRAALMAHYRLGNLYYGLGDVDRAIGSYREFLKKSPEESDLVPLAQRGLGYCYEAKGDFARALASFQDALKAPAGKYFEALTYRDMARLYEATQETGKSVECYRKALEKSVDPVTIMLLKRKIATLG